MRRWPRRPSRKDKAAAKMSPIFLRRQPKQGSKPLAADIASQRTSGRTPALAPRRHSHHHTNPPRATFAVGFAGGYVAEWLHFPLPYMTGSLLVTAALGLAGVPVRSVWHARAAGQFVTGTAIGTSFTPALLLSLLTMFRAIVRRRRDLDPDRGGRRPDPDAARAVDAAHRVPCRHARRRHRDGERGGRVGADPLPIMVLQTMRVGLTVCVAPFLATGSPSTGAAEVVRAEVMSWLTARRAHGGVVSWAGDAVR